MPPGVGGTVTVPTMRMLGSSARTSASLASQIPMSLRSVVHKHTHTYVHTTQDGKTERVVGWLYVEILEWRASHVPNGITGVGGKLGRWQNDRALRHYIVQVYFSISIQVTKPGMNLSDFTPGPQGTCALSQLRYS